MPQAPATVVPARLLLLLALAFGLVLAACEEPPPPEPKVDPPLVAVNLPAIPGDLGQSSIPEKLPDGSLTIDGLLRKRLAMLDKPVQVSGFITWVYDCPHKLDDKERARRRRQKKKKKDGEEEEVLMCERPHFAIADSMDAKESKRMLVVGVKGELEESFEKEDLKVGQKHVIRGTYTDLADGFAAPDKGLILLGTVAGFEPKPEDER